MASRELQRANKCVVEHMDVHDAGSASKPNPAHNAGWTLCTQWNAFSFVPFLSVGEAGERSLSRGKPSSLQLISMHPLISCTSLFTSHRLWIIQLSDFHMRTVREDTRIACSLSLLFLSLLLLLSLFSSAQSHFLMHHCHSDTGITWMGRNHPPPIMYACSIPWRRLNVKTEAGLMLFCQKSTFISSKQTTFPGTQFIRKEGKKIINFSSFAHVSNYNHMWYASLKYMQRFVSNIKNPSCSYLITHQLTKYGTKIWAANSSPPASCDKKWWGIQVHRKGRRPLFGLLPWQLLCFPPQPRPHDLQGAIDRLQSKS